MHRDPFQIVRQVPGFASILARKPLLAAAVLRSQAIEWRRGRAGKKSLSSIDFAVTYACQASCEHCSATSLHDKVREKNRLSFSEMAVLGRKLADMGVYEVNFTGGEPTLLKDLEAIIACFNPHRTFIGLNTNADLIDAKRLSSLSDAGVDLMKMSLDSADPETHDQNRGLPGNFAHVIKLLREIQALNGIRGHICSVASPTLLQNGDVERLIELAAQYDATIGFSLPVAVGRWGGQYEVTLADEDLERLRQACRHPRAFFQGSVGLSDFTCPGGRTEIYISPYGDILPCPYVQRSFGNLRDQELGNIFSNMATAADLAGDASLCLAAQSQRWMKNNVPSSRQRTDVPNCAADHPDSFCRRPDSRVV